MGPITRLMFLLLSALAALVTAAPAFAHIFDVEQQEFVPFATMLQDLQETRLVFIGELHDNIGHHRAQLQIIRALNEAGVPVTIGLEMFRRDSQQALDQWVAGDLGEDEFLSVYRDNWSMWPAYQEIFRYARDRDVPLLGLNLPREITRQVAREGFDSLSGRQRGELPLVRCNVDLKYQQYMRRVLGKHAHGGAAFRNFCEAQLVWDVVMARNLLEYLDAHPERLVVVLAGSGHAWKFGIPEQIRRHSPAPLRVVLPEIAGRVEMGNATVEVVDYLLLGTDEGPLH